MRLKFYFSALLVVALLLPSSFAQDEEPPEAEPEAGDGGATGSDPHELQLIYGQNPNTPDVPATVIRAPEINAKEIDKATDVKLMAINEASFQTDSKNAIAVAKGLLNNVTANAVSKIGDDAIALATNGSSADALALTMNGDGSASAGATTHGDLGAKSAAFSQGTGTATAAAKSQGIGTARSDALAKENNASAVAEAKVGGGVANAIAHETGHSVSKASTSEGGSGKAISLSTGTGAATAGSHAVGGGNATSLSKSKDGDALGEALSHDGGAAYSASWAKELGNSSTKSVTYGGGGSKAESLADGAGLSTAKAYQLHNNTDIEVDVDATLDDFGVRNGEDVMDDRFFHGDKAPPVLPPKPTRAPEVGPDDEHLD